MTGFDPVAAADAYLQRLPAAALAAAPAQTAWAEALGVATVIVVVLACWAVARSGLLVRLRERLEVSRRPRWIADAVCGAVLAGLVALACSPLALVAAARDGSGTALPALVMSLRQAVLFAVAGAIFAPLLYGLMRLSARGWSLIGGAALAALVFALAWLPFASASGPAALPIAPAGPARAGLLRLISDTGLPAREVYVSANPAIDADVTGAGAARVVVSRGLWTQGSPAEIRASIGHLMGHYAHRDQLSIAVLLAVLTLGLFMALGSLFPLAARLVGASGVKSVADPAGAPALMALAAVYLACAVTLDHGFIRWINVRADQYSLDQAREPDGLAAALLHEWRGEAPNPSAIQQALFYDHPSLQSRLLHAMRWKAAHPS